MLKHHLHTATSHVLFHSLPKSPSPYSTISNWNHASATSWARSVSADRPAPTVPTLRQGGPSSARCSARRRPVRYGLEDDEEQGEEEEQYGHNQEIAMLELYSQSARGEALIVHASVDGEDVEVLIFKGFSSSLSYGTSPDPSRSILPSRAEIKSVDRVKGPFDPSNIEYIEKGLTWENFKTNFLAN